MDHGLCGLETGYCLRAPKHLRPIQDGEPIAYVQEQLGHSSIKLTVDTYTHWMRASVSEVFKAFFNDRLLLGETISGLISCLN